MHFVRTYIIWLSALLDIVALQYFLIILTCDRIIFKIVLAKEWRWNLTESFNAAMKERGKGREAKGQTEVGIIEDVNRSNWYIFIITNTMHTTGVDKITLFKTT